MLGRVTLDDVARITAEQFAELARFVNQADPDVRTSCSRSCRC
jgi:hypothetical protein